MEYERLVIRNIASIEHAEIDFSSGLLAEEPLFLICGETGAGKSTILDAICLALFKKTPRMSERGGQSGEISDGNVGVGFFDARQLMRKNTAEAYVRLDFIGSDMERYTAEWSVARARRKVNGALQPEKWRLADHTAGINYDKVRDIERVIGDAVGLTFEQFCRTSMLAQGEFTRFLKSPDKEKAAILEKLTGTGLFSEVGMAISRITKEKSDACDAQRRKLDGIQVLDEAALAEKNTELQNAKALSAALSQQKEADELKMQWLKRAQELQAELKTKRTVFEAALVTAESEEMQEARKNVEDWRLTESVRQSILNVRAFDEELKRCEAKEAECLDTFLQLEAEESVLSGERQTLDGRLANAAEYFKGVAAQEQMLKDGKALADALAGALDSEREAKRAAEAQKRYEKDAEEQNGKLNVRKNAYDRSKKIYENVERRFRGEKDRFDAMGPEKVHDESMRLDALGKDVRTAMEGLDSLLKKEKDLEEERVRVRQANEDLEKERQLKTGKENECQAEKENRDRAVKAYESQSEMVGDMAKELRSRLVEGERCPVCGQIVVHVLSDERIESLLEPFRKAKNDAEEKYRNIKEALDTLKVSVRSKETDLEGMRKNLKLHSDQYESSRNSVFEQAMGCIRSWCDWQSRTDMSAGEMSTGALRKRLESVAKEVEAAYGAAQAKKNLIEESRRVIDGLNEELRKAQKSCSDELEAVADAQNDLNKARSMAQGQKTVAQSYFQSAAKKLESVSSRILIADWKRVWATDPESLERTIREKSEKYAQAVELKESLENSRKDISTLIGTFSQMAESVCGKFPKWRQISGERAGQVSEPFRRRWAAQMAGKGSRDFRLEEWKPFFEPRWANLLSMTASLSAEKGAAEKGLAKERGNVEEFFRLHQDVGTERVGWLMSNLTEESAGAIAEKLKSIDTALEKARTEYAQVEAGVRAHELSKPELRDGDTVETLESEMRDADSRRTLEDRKVGAIEASLRLNEQNLLLRRSDQARLHDLEEEYQRWKSLNAMFGSADGSRFRGIAQAFILKQLLMCANHYLKHFSPRYELDCQPGSVGIVIRDLYQGDAVRPYSTLSGGEGFIVSLALALGLSAMTRGNASVDVLFIDEGFGTLSEDYLNTVIDTLSRLHETGGRKVGIISHVDILRERISAQIRLLRENNTASRVEVVRL